MIAPWIARVRAWLNPPVWSAGEQWVHDAAQRAWRDGDNDAWVIEASRALTAARAARDAEHARMKSARCGLYSAYPAERLRWANREGEFSDDP